MFWKKAIQKKISYKAIHNSDLDALKVKVVGSGGLQRRWKQVVGSITEKLFGSILFPG